jgi:hypothetical protein
MIMNCERCAEDLTAYLDGELPPQRAAEIRAHLNECGNCASEMQGLADSAAFLESNTKEIPLRPEIWNNVKAQLSTMEAAQPADFTSFWLWRWPRVAATVFATASVLVLGFWGYLSYEESRESLRHYMNEYVTARDAQLHKQGMANALASANSNAGGGIQFERMDNPFAEPLTDTYHNPFRSEDE